MALPSQVRILPPQPRERRSPQDHLRAWRSSGHVTGSRASPRGAGPQARLRCPPAGGFPGVQRVGDVTPLAFPFAVPTLAPAPPRAPLAEGSPPRLAIERLRDRIPRVPEP